MPSQTTDAATHRHKAMLMLRDFRVPDDVIGFCFGLTRQRVHKLIGPLPPKPKPVSVDSLAKGIHFAQALYDWRDARGLSQDEAATLLRMPGRQSTISAWERGEPCKHAEQILFIMQKLDEEKS